MNPGQEMFYNFIIARVVEGKMAEAKALLEDCFVKQSAGTFDKNMLDEVTPRFYSIIRPEAYDELKEAMDSFRSRI